MHKIKREIRVAHLGLKLIFCLDFFFVCGYFWRQNLQIEPPLPPHFCVNGGKTAKKKLVSGTLTFVGRTNDELDGCTTLFGALTTFAPGILSAGRFSLGPVLELLFRRFSGRDLYFSRFYMECMNRFLLQST